MKTFELELNETEWQEVLQGKGFVAFDMVASSTAEVLFTETGLAPQATRKGNDVTTWSNDWDFVASNLVQGVQRVWVRGKGAIRGVR